MGRNLLIISDEHALPSSLGETLAPLGCGVTVKKGIASGLKAITGSEIILLDLPSGPEGAAGLKEIKSYYPDSIVLLAVDGGGNGVCELDAHDFIEKPVSPARIKTAVKNALAYASLREKLDGKVAEEPVIGRSPATQKVLRLIDNCSKKGSSVLIAGERGTGKTHTARAIHMRSACRTGPLVALENPSERELFGSGKEPGKISSAIGGCLLVKGVKAAVRDKLLTGGGADVRIIFTQNGAEEIPAAGIETIIKLTPLRERQEDIIPLAEHFLGKSEKSFGLAPKRLTKDAARSLLKHPWPGNVKELELTIRRAYILSRSEKIDKCLLGIEDDSIYGSVREFLDDKLKRYIKGMAKVEGSGLYDAVMSEVEKSLIDLALGETGGNQVRAAKALGLNRNTLRAKIKAYGLNGIK